MISTICTFIYIIFLCSNHYQITCFPLHLTKYENDFLPPTSPSLLLHIHIDTIRKGLVSQSHIPWERVHGWDTSIPSVSLTKTCHPWLSSFLQQHPWALSSKQSNPYLVLPPMLSWKANTLSPLVWRFPSPLNCSYHFYLYPFPLL
jgi:hypothetical protein